MQATKMRPAQTSGIQQPIVLPLLASSTAAMPHDSRKKRATDERRSQRNCATKQRSQLIEQATEYTARARQRGDPQIPFYDDPNHVACGWQQVSALPGIFSFVGGMENNSRLSPQSRPQTWPVEQQSDNDEDEPSGFNPHPVRGQGPRRPRPLTEFKGRYGHSRGGPRKLKPFFDPPAGHEDADASADDRSDRLTSSVLVLKDVNQKLRDDQSRVSPFSKLTGRHGQKSRPLSKRLIVDELEGSQQADRGTERMKPLYEEPAPLTVRKSADTTGVIKSSTLKQARVPRAQQQRAAFVEANSGNALKKDGLENEGVEGLMAAITAQLSTFTVQPDKEFEHRSAVPQPLDPEAIKAAKETRRRTRLRDEAKGGILGGVEEHDKLGSVKSFAIGTSSEFENLSIPDSSEHNGAKRKWYKVLRRSE
ncbi:hypothetical protein E8E12_005290 [Didymella heteroderae]|uniref:Uncharacterized protein n=1 Tax=Didymella heteroderae TaxID=1769908 RepID=A0A9P4WKH9_9PLEO|nr:hypothetical protein E8E12_005290 [Didymella heteroderae]